MKKRQFIKTGIVAMAGTVFIPNQLIAEATAMNKFVLPPLPYAFDALEPFIDKATMEIHYTKHHQAYINNLNKATEGTELEKLSIEDICKNISKYLISLIPFLPWLYSDRKSTRLNSSHLDLSRMPSSA